MVSTEEPKTASMVTGEAGPGTALKDLLPLPDSTQPVTDPTRVEKSHTLDNDVTLSHALANEDHSDKGAAQEGHDEAEVQDLGWHEKKQDIASPLVGGVDNEDLWLLIRRFNKQMYHVKSITYPPPGGLDLVVSDDEEFSPDKLRANLERFYTTVAMGFLGALKHIARIRSWRETRRTALFCTAYTIAWIFDFVVPLLASTVLILILYPPARGFLFPPAPLALVDSKSGGVQKPKAGVLGSHDSMTGAPENHKGEAVEQEASNFVDGVASVAVSSVAGKHPPGDPHPDSSDGLTGKLAPDPTVIVNAASDAKEQTAGAKPPAKHDKTKQPMETVIWTKMRPVMHGISDVTDTWERFGNALSPTKPFPQETYRLRIATLVIPLLGISLFVTPYMVVKGLLFGVGFGFFGDPIISPAIDFLNRKIPNWQKLLELRNTLLKGVPTNAQLTITLLRVGEANRAPLPPAPRMDSPPPNAPKKVTEEHYRAAGGDEPLGASKEEFDDAIAYDEKTAVKPAHSDMASAKADKHGKLGNKILGLFRGTAAGGVKTAIGIDKVRAKLGSKPAKEREGVVPKPPGVDEDRVTGPVDFICRYEGKKGHVYISTTATIPAVGFSTDETIEKIGSRNRTDLHPLWSVAISDITEIKKFGGFGWKAKLVVGWSLGREIEDGLEIQTVTGESHRITACPLRDELFNRLVAMGGQKWEVL